MNVQTIGFLLPQLLSCDLGALGEQGVEDGDLEHYWSQIEFEATLEYIF